MLRFILILAIFTTGALAQVSESDINYYLWNSKTSSESLSNNNFGNNIDTAAPVKILIHGWTDSISASWYAGARNNYVSLGYNVICVDWSKHSQQLYATSVARLSAIGEFVASFIINLSNNNGISITNFHVIGHSLGAHLGGFAGKHVQTQSGLTLGRITGLDPAGPSFYYASSSNRLNQNDAVYVDTVITDSGLSGYGISLSLGIVNFRPNGGTGTQPGCLYVSCSHYRSCVFYNEGILSNNFVARQCSSWLNYSLGLCRSNSQNRLGENVDFTVTGDFYLSTNAISPYAQG